MHQKKSESSAEFQPHLGRAVGAYLLHSIVGIGGMGAVFVATHTRLDKKVAVKLLRGSFRHQKGAASRFFSEAKAAAAIGHENIIEVFDVGEDAEVGPFLAMELLETSESLGSLLMREGPLPLARVSKITLQIANALFATHAAGLVHCDLKPSNILLIEALGQSDVVKIIDFGIARETPSPNQDPLISSRLVLGTPKFMSPEQAIGRRPDGRSDQYALGLLVYTMLTGKPPFDGTPSEVMKRQYHDPPASLRAKRQDVTALLEDVVLRALAKKPDERFPSIKQFGEIFYDTVDKLLRPSTIPRLPVALPTQPKPDLSSYKAMFEDEGGLTGGHAAAKPALLPPDLSHYKAMLSDDSGLTGGAEPVSPHRAELPPKQGKAPVDVSHYKAMLSDDSGLTGEAPPLSSAPQLKPNLAQYKELFESEGGATGAVAPLLLEAPPTKPSISSAVDVSQYKAMFEGGATGDQAPSSPQTTKEPADIFSLLGRSPTPSPVPLSPPKPTPVPPLQLKATTPPTPTPEPQATLEPRNRAVYVVSGVGALLLFVGIGLYWGYLSGYLAPTNLPIYARQATSKKVLPSFVPQTAPAIVDEKKDPRLTPKNNPKPNPDGTIPEILPPPIDPTPETPKPPAVIDVPDFGTPEVKSLPPS